MADEFERRLERMFAEAPDVGDAAAFAERVERRLARGWVLRRGLIGAAGLLGGLIAASQLLGGLGPLAAAADHSGHVIARALAGLEAPAAMLSALPGGFGVWSALVLAVLTTGFALSRVIEEI